MNFRYDYYLRAETDSYFARLNNRQMGSLYRLQLKKDINKHEENQSSKMSDRYTMTQFT